MQTGNRSTPTTQSANWLPNDGQTLPCISAQDLQAMDALFENLDAESVERDLLAKKSPAINFTEWDLVDLIA